MQKGHACVAFFIGTSFKVFSVIVFRIYARIDVCAKLASSNSFHGTA